MEANFTTEEFIAYLKGNIIKYALRSKGQDLADAQKIRHYAEKLIEVQKGRPVIAIDKPEEIDEPTLVECKKEYTYKIGDRAWFASEDDLKHITKEEPKKTLEPNKWYDAEDFTVNELKALLPVGTVVVVTEEHDNNRIVDLEEEKLLNTTIKNIGQRYVLHDTRVGITADGWWRRHFKITEE
nr:MAG TPA: nucelotide kinase [Caudoviricetes sp.]